MTRPTKAIRFTAPLLTGHKGDAVEVPFDPAATWGLPARRLRSGRRGHPVEGTLNGVAIESVIVGRSKRFFLLVDKAARRTAGARLGDALKISIRPAATARPDDAETP